MGLSVCAKFGNSRTFHALTKPCMIGFSHLRLISISHLPNVFGCNSLTFDHIVPNLWPGYQSVGLSMCAKLRYSRTFHACAVPCILGFYHLRLMSQFTFIKCFGCISLIFDARVTKLGPSYQSVGLSICAKFGNS